MNGDPRPQRVVLWSVPRSLSTVFEKCMSFVPKTQIINEPFACAYHIGPEKKEDINASGSDSGPGLDVKEEDTKKYEAQIDEKSKKFDLPMAFETNECTYQFVKDELEADYPDKNLVFCKDMAYGLDAKYDMLPVGYRHTFIIRHPYRMFISYRKMFANVMQAFGQNEFRFCDLPPTMLPKGYAFKEEYELMQYVKENCEDEPVIIDADDLLTNPTSIMKQYCNLLGIEFKEEMLEWPSGLDVIKSWKGSREIMIGNLLESGGYYDAALKSTRFHPPKNMPTRDELSEDIVPCVDQSMPFYEKMYELRLKP